MDGGCSLLDSEASCCHWLSFNDWAISVDCEILRFAVSGRKSLIPASLLLAGHCQQCRPKFSGRSVSLSCWPLSTVPSQVFWQECLTELLAIVNSAVPSFLAGVSHWAAGHCQQCRPKFSGRSVSLSCWPLSTVPSQVFWQECLTELLAIVNSAVPSFLAGVSHWAAGHCQQCRPKFSGRSVSLSCWPLSTVPSQVFWQECLTELLAIVNSAVPSFLAGVSHWAAGHCQQCRPKFSGWSVSLSCWPLSTVPSQVFWQECLTELLAIVNSAVPSFLAGVSHWAAGHCQQCRPKFSGRSVSLSCWPLSTVPSQVFWLECLTELLAIVNSAVPSFLAGVSHWAAGHCQQCRPKFSGWSVSLSCWPLSTVPSQVFWQECLTELLAIVNSAVPSFLAGVSHWAAGHCQQCRPKFSGWSVSLSCWPLSTVPSQVFWQECLTELLAIVNSAVPSFLAGVSHWAAGHCQQCRPKFSGRSVSLSCWPLSTVPSQVFWLECLTELLAIVNSAVPSFLAGVSHWAAGHCQQCRPKFSGRSVSLSCWPLSTVPSQVFWLECLTELLAIVNSAVPSFLAGVSHWAAGHCQQCRPKFSGRSVSLSCWPLSTVPSQVFWLECLTELLAIVNSAVPSFLAGVSHWAAGHCQQCRPKFSGWSVSLSCWPLSTVPSQVFWQECLTELLAIVNSAVPSFLAGVSHWAAGHCQQCRPKFSGRSVSLSCWPLSTVPSQVFWQECLTELLAIVNSAVPSFLAGVSHWAAGHCQQCRPKFSGRSVSLSCWPLSTVPSQVFWQECLTELLESLWVPLPLHGLLELCQLACLQYWVLCLTHPRLALSQSLDKKVHKIYLFGVFVYSPSRSLCLSADSFIFQIPIRCKKFQRQYALFLYWPIHLKQTSLFCLVVCHAQTL